jgi:hypothetical protein
VRLPRAVAAAVMVVGMIVAAAACGSSDDNGLSKADFITQADAICKKYNDLSIKATSGLKNPTDAELVAAIKAKIVPLLPKQEAELRALKPPKADRAVVEQFLDTLQKASDELANDTAAIVKTKGASANVAQVSEESAAYGFTVCGAGGR